jgi:hypothetical protein
VLSSPGNIGTGRNVIGFGRDIVLVAVWSAVVIMLLAVRALGLDETTAMVERVDRSS